MDDQQRPNACREGTQEEKAASAETEALVGELVDALNSLTEHREEFPLEPNKEAPSLEETGRQGAEASAQEGTKEPPVQENPQEPEMPVDEAQRDEEERSEEERRRVADMTRTVQVSIEQIIARAAEQEAAARAEIPPAAAPPQQEEPDGEEEYPVTLRERIGGGLLRLGKWFMLVVFLVLVIAGAGIAWLYRGATPDTLPQISVTVEGQELPAMAYDWKVPVVGHLIQRTYAETVMTGDYELPETLDGLRPEIHVQPSGLETTLVVQDDAGQEIYNGALDRFGAVGLPASGRYRARLVVAQPASRFIDANEVTGSQTYQFLFDVNILPSVRLSTQSAEQGSIVAIRVNNVSGEERPTLQCDLENTGFVKASTGWVLYLPIPRDAQPGSYQLRVATQDHEETFGLTVRAGTWVTKDYGSSSRLVTPYLGLEDTPPEVESLLEACGEEIGWSKTGFVQPFLSSVTISLPYGATEYVGRTSSQIANGSGSGRTATNVVVATKAGESLIAPANGEVLLAKDLGGTAGNTVVIEHGAGLKSIFYGMADLKVKKGDNVVRGQSLGTTGRSLIAEARIGTVPVEPFSIWRGQCEAIKNY